MTPREEVLEATARFAAATDAKDWETLRAMLTEDVAAYGQSGADAVVATMRQHLDGTEATQHLLGNHRVTLSACSGSWREADHVAGAWPGVSARSQRKRPAAVIGRLRQRASRGRLTARNRVQEQPLTGEPDPDTARVFSYGRVYHVGAGPMHGAYYECLGDYDDTWVRRDGEWLLAARWFDIRISLGDVSVLRPAA